MEVVADIRRGEGGAVVAGGEEGAQGAGGARGTGGAGGKGNAVKTAMLKFFLLYPLYSCALCVPAQIVGSVLLFSAGHEMTGHQTRPDQTRQDQTRPDQTKWV